MKAFLRGCLFGLYIVGVITACVTWFYILTLIPSPLVQLLYIAGTIILTCGFVGWYTNP